tara:strand:+ start:292 stop:897 length:606 start_codon:yes stop_codon:yes gene_type:complete
MKQLLLLIGISFFYANGITQNRYDLAVKFQQDMNMEYADSLESPLTDEDRLKFTGLPFFPIDTNLIVTAKVDVLSDQEVFEMETTTDRLPLYRPYYTASFSIDTLDFSLTIYQSEDLKTRAGYEKYLFLPFTDITNGDESYGGGRYIDLEITESDSIIIDFNRAYNPYCAYNKKYSCPIPPRENDVNYAIRAGVKFPSEYK